ncbi:Nitrate reductase [NADH] 1 [Dichanthelium oligosanthes]|uniref:Nitrate reductase [NADH] 1 n=1 Tax=Dichanthelium oligosanthes TaxID=888268 RepID=A0A1E5W0G8_9POAL|nr:Nitrate reductase [NADH] 1 [Dichanthelium oligosanthes]
MTMAASVEPAQVARLELTSAQMLALMNGTMAYPPVPSHIPRRADRGFTAVVTSHAWDEDDDEQADWRDLYGSHLHLHRELEPAVHDPRDEGTADAWIKRDPSLIRLTGKHPLNCEPPLAQLMRHGFITPAPLHYVRNHGPVPRGDWATWTVEVTGLVKRPARFTMEQLVRDFPAVEVPVTLVCSSNRRKEQNMVRQTVGFNWGPAAVSTSVWRGARLCDVLRRCGVVPRRGGALNVCFEGADDLPGGGGTTYATSIRRDWALDPTMDVMLAYMQNGEPLPPDHGFPVRVIVPGCTAGRMVKWLKRIVITTAESDNYYHYRDNRVLPPHVDAELADAEGWWYKPEHVINELNVNSVITTPGHDEVLPVNATTTQGGYTMKGYAYSGGGKKVTRVEVTLDGGETWLQCELNHPEKPNKYGKHWCWCFWSVEVEVLDLVGAKEIAVRAWDQSLNTQPEKLIWNLMGMMNNCWFKVKVNVCQPHKGEIGLQFEHPVQPGNNPSGWMARQKNLDAAQATVTGLKRSTPKPIANVNTTDDKQFTMAEHLESLPIGSYIDVKGPLGHVVYAGRGSFVINGKPPRQVRRLAMIAGGSGIAPMYQVIQTVLRDQPEDRTMMHLVYANRTEDDILLCDELDRWAAEYPERLKVWYVVDQVKRPEEGWKYSVGFVTEAILREHVPEGGDDTLALACGPPPMIQYAIAPNLEKMKYHRSSSFVVF